MTNTDFSAPRDITPNRMGTAGFALSIGYTILFILYAIVAKAIANAGIHMTDSVFSYLSMVLILNVWLLGLIFSIGGLRSQPKGKAIAGLIISLLPIILFLFTAIIVSPQISTPIRFENASKMSAPPSVRSEPNISVMLRISTNWRDFFMQIQPN